MFRLPSSVVELVSHKYFVKICDEWSLELAHVLLAYMRLQQFDWSGSYCVGSFPHSLEGALVDQTEAITVHSRQRGTDGVLLHSKNVLQAHITSLSENYFYNKVCVGGGAFSREGFVSSREWP